MSGLPEFKNNSHLTVGVELELQLVNLHSFNLAMEAGDFLRRLSETAHPGEIKPEITQAMVEINSSIHHTYSSLKSELLTIKNIMTAEALNAHLGICGGGTHAFQKWNQQRIYPAERFASVSEQYGYLAKQFTVFGQHIHVACFNGDDALYLCHAMMRYIPQFIALSAASPFQQSVDTSFDCSRLAVINAFPLSGTPPWLMHWSAFEDYFQKMATLNIVTSMKDFYWDIRPKPEYGTVELRICDTPLTVEKAATLAAYMQLLVHWLLTERPAISKDIYLTYFVNRFRGARYGLDAIIVDPIQQKHIPLVEDILETCEKIEKYASLFDSHEALEKISQEAQAKENGAKWLRDRYEQMQTLSDMVRAQTELWMQ